MFVLQGDTCPSALAWRVPWRETVHCDTSVYQQPDDAAASVPVEWWVSVTSPY